MSQKQNIAKFDIKDMLPIGMTLVITGIAIAFGLEIIGDTKPDMCDYNYDAKESKCYECANQSTFPTFNTTDNLCYNATTVDSNVSVDRTTTELNATVSSMQGIAKLPEKMPMIATVIVAAIIIGILVRYLWVRMD